MSERFLKLHSVELAEKYHKKLNDFFKLEVRDLSNVNQYIKNGAKNAILDDLSIARGTISFDPATGFSLNGSLEFASSTQASPNPFSPLNSSSISSESVDFIRSCYPEYYNASKKDSFFYKHENECCILPEASKCFYIRAGKEGAKYKAPDIFPRQIGFAYNLEEGRRVYKGFGYHKFKENSQEVRFEGLEVYADVEEGKFIAQIDPDFNRVVVNLPDIPEDRFVYIPLGDIVKEHNRIRVFNWSGNRA